MWPDRNWLSDRLNFAGQTRQTWLHDGKYTSTHMEVFQEWPVDINFFITASNSGVQYDRGMIAYCTTKHAVIAMTRQIAVDYAADNVRCNALCPGFVDTPFNHGFEAQLGEREALETYVTQSVPMGRWASVDEVAASIVYLASDQSGFMTGHALAVDGGEYL